MMKVYLARSFGAALIYMFAAQGAMAQLTAKEVWSEWSEYFSGVGYEVSGTETMSGSTLTVSDLSLVMPLPEADGTVTIAVGEVRFSENSDGTINVALPNDFPIRFDGANDDDEPVVVLVGYSQSGSSMIVSGSPRDMLYNYTAAQVDIALSSITIDGAPLPDGTARASLSLANVITSTQVKKSDLRNYSQRLSADSLSYDFFAADLESDDKAEIRGSMQGIRSEGTGILPLEMDTADIQEMLRNGFEFDGRFSYASGNGNIQGTGDGEDFSVVTSSQGGALGMAMNASDFSYDVSQKGTSLTINTVQFPVPIELQLAVSGFSVSMPIARSDEPQDFAFSMELGDFTMSEMLWSMFDPAAVLPRDPATVAMNIAGKTRVLLDFMDPEVAEMLGQSDAPPFELNALTINKLLVSMIGASVSGNGDFTFDNTDMVSFDGIPRPTGFIELQVVGANGLLDKLIQMGIVAEEQAMGARMMMGMLAVPGDGPDTLNSKIEINDQGHILANGQRIQ